MAYRRDDDRGRRHGASERAVFSPDETRLYVVDTPSGGKTTHVMMWTATAGRCATGGCSDGKPGYADGIRCDTEGNVWCGFSGGVGQDGVAVFVPDGTDRSILLRNAAPICASRRKRNRLFMTASQSVYALYVEAQGAPGG